MVAGLLYSLSRGSDPTIGGRPSNEEVLGWGGLSHRYDEALVIGVAMGE